MTVFVDTSALYAVLDRDDDFHSAAREVWIRLLSGGESLVTSNYVVLECFALVQNRLGMDALGVFSDDVLPAMSVLWTAEEDHSSAAQAVLAAGRRDLSLVDCSSFILMRQAGIRTAFAFDKHFAEQGFEILPS